MELEILRNLKITLIPIIVAPTYLELPGKETGGTRNPGKN